MAVSRLKALCTMFDCASPKFQIGDPVKSIWKDVGIDKVFTDRGVITGLLLHPPNSQFGATWVYQVTWYEMESATRLCIQPPWTEDAYEENLEPDID